jgi:hypothetical protein
MIERLRAQLLEAHRKQKFAEDLVDRMKQKALVELAKYEEALKECYTERCMSLAEGLLAGFCVVGLLTKEQGKEWQERFHAIRRPWLERMRPSTQR